MSWLSELEKIRTDSTFSVVILGLIFLVAPGIAFLFMFERQLISQLDTLKLVLIALAVEAPLIIFNLILTSASDGSSGEDWHERLFLYLNVATVISGVVIYAVLLVAYFANINVKTFVIIVLIMEIILLLDTLNTRRRSKSLKKGS